MGGDDKPAGGSRLPFGVVLIVLLLAGLGLGRVLAPRLRIGKLVAALADPQRRDDAGRRLYQDEGPAAIPALIDYATDTAHPLHARGDAVELLGRIGGAHRDLRPVPVVLGLKEPELAQVRLEALGRLRGPEALAELLAALRGEDTALKFPALRVLAEPEWREVDTATLLPIVEPFLAHEQWGLREHAAKFMGVRRHEPAVPALIARLRDPEGPVRQMAAWSLAQIGGDAAVAAIQSALESGAISPDGL